MKLKYYQNNKKETLISCKINQINNKSWPVLRYINEGSFPPFFLLYELNDLFISHFMVYIQPDEPFLSLPVEKKDIWRLHTKTFYSVEDNNT